MSGSISGAPVVGTNDVVYNVPIINGGTVTKAGSITTPATIAASGTFTSGVVPTYGMSHVAVSAQIDQVGSIVVQPYLDAAGTIPNGAPVTKALTASTLAVLDNVGTVVTQAITVAIVNGATVVANLASGKFAAAISSR